MFSNTINGDLVMMLLFESQRNAKRQILPTYQVKASITSKQYAFSFELSVEMNMANKIWALREC